jgi:hypothetical protein
MSGDSRGGVTRAREAIRAVFRAPPSGRGDGLDEIPFGAGSGGSAQVVGEQDDALSQGAGSGPRSPATAAAIGAAILLVVFAVVAALGVTGHLALSAPCGSQDPGSCSRVPFIGNSYTSVNDLPSVFASLARAGGHDVETGMVAPGGSTLSEHASSAETLGMLASSKWDFVVLQEQSQLPAIEQVRRQQMYPAARSLVRSIWDAGARPVFFMTWTHRAGWPEYGLPDYQSMQAQVGAGYLAIARELGVSVAPVGYAWSAAYAKDPRLELWQADGSHPSQLRTYLAACVFYAAIFRQSPEGSSYLAGVPNDTAQVLQATAAHLVLDGPAQWDLP